METVRGKDLGIVACGNCLEETDVVVRMRVVTKDVDKRKAGVRVDLWMCPACGSRLAVNVRKLTSAVRKEGRLLKGDFGRRQDSEQEAEREAKGLSPAERELVDGPIRDANRRPGTTGTPVDKDPGQERDD
jgi:hypothetical protein